MYYSSARTVTGVCSSRSQTLTAETTRGSPTTSATGWRQPIACSTPAAGLDAFEGLTERLVAVRDNSDDAVVLGHTHVPGTERVGGVAVINPGSHADPRGSRPAYATLEPGDGELRGRLHTPEGEVFAAFRVQGPERKQAVEGGPQFG